MAKKETSKREETANVPVQVLEELRKLREEVCLAIEAASNASYRLMDAEELCRAMQISRQTLRRYEKQLLIPERRNGRGEELYRHGFTTLEGVKNVVGAVGEVIDRLTLPAREKRQLEVDVLELLAEHEKEIARSRSAAVVEEARGNWLQRSWRPLVMLVFALIVLVGTFTTLPILSDTSRFWDLLEIGLGGYVVGRSGEKIVQAFTGKKRF